MSVYAGPADWWTDGTDGGRNHIATKGIVQNGLILNLDAGVSSSYPGSGTTWTDLKASGNNGILTNSPTFSNSNGGILTFDGIDDYVEVPFETILTNCSFEILFKATSTRSYQYLLSLGSASTNNFSLNFDMNDPDGSGFAQTMWVYWNSGGTPNSGVPKSGTFGDWNDSAWRHYVFTRGSTTNHYMNGNLLTNTVRNGDQTTQFGNGAGYKLKIGTIRINAYYFPGSIPVVRVYNRELSATEIQQNFNALRGRFGI